MSETATFYLNIRQEHNELCYNFVKRDLEDMTVSDGVSNFALYHCKNASTDYIGSARIPFYGRIASTSEADGYRICGDGSGRVFRHPCNHEGNLVVEIDKKQAAPGVTSLENTGPVKAWKDYLADEERCQSLVEAQGIYLIHRRGSDGKVEWRAGVEWAAAGGSDRLAAVVDSHRVIRSQFTSDMAHIVAARSCHTVEPQVIVVDAAEDCVFMIRKIETAWNDA